MKNDQPRVLIVENDDILRVLIFTVLRHQPVGVDTAASIEEALDRVSKCDYALIVVDVDMPDRAGERFLREFRERRPEATTFVLAVRDPQNEIYLDSKLVSAIVHKPLEIDTLGEMVRECAIVVPPPDDPLPCSPSESDIRDRLDRSSYITN